MNIQKREEGKGNIKVAYGRFLRLEADLTAVQMVAAQAALYSKVSTNDEAILPHNKSLPTPALASTCYPNAHRGNCELEISRKML